MKYQGYPVVGGNQNLTSLTIEKNKGIIQNVSGYDPTSDLTMDIMREQAIASVNELITLPFEAFDFTSINEEIFYLVQKSETLSLYTVPVTEKGKTINFLVKATDGTNLAEEIIFSITGGGESGQNGFDINIVVVADDNIQKFEYQTINWYPKSYTETRYFWNNDTPIQQFIGAGNFENSENIIYTNNFILCDKIPAIYPINAIQVLPNTSFINFNINVQNSKMVLNDNIIVLNNYQYMDSVNSRKASIFKYTINNSIVEYGINDVYFNSPQQITTDAGLFGELTGTNSINFNTILTEKFGANFHSIYIGSKDIYPNEHKFSFLLDRDIATITYNLQGDLISDIFGLNPSIDWVTGILTVTIPVGNTSNFSSFVGVITVGAIDIISDQTGFDFKDSNIMVVNGSKFGYFGAGTQRVPTTLEACLLRPIDNNNVTVSDFSKKVSCYKAPLIENGVVVAEILNMRLPEYNNAYDKEINGKMINADNWLVDSQRISGSSIYESLIYQVLSKPVMDFLTVGTGASPLYGLTLSVASSEISQLNRKTYVLNIDSSEYTDIRAINIESDVVITKRPDIDLTGFYFNKYGVFKADGTEYFPSWAENFFILAKDPIDDSIHILGVVQNRIVPSRFSDNNKIVFDDGQYNFVSAFQILQPLDNNITNTFISVQSQKYPDDRGVGSVQFLDLTPSMTISQFSIF